MLNNRLLPSGSVAFALAGSLLFLASTTAATAHGKKPLVLSDLSTFYVGGTIEFSACNDSNDCNNPRQGPGNISVNAMYVEKATPEKKTFKYPIVFLHGGGHNGQVFRTTPDGRDGWFDSFLRRGFEVYVLDGSNRGRAGWDPVKRIQATRGLIPASQMEAVNTYSEQSAWTAFRWGPQPGVLYPNSQFPIGALNQYLPQLNTAYRDAEANQLLAANIGALIDKIGPCILLGWSTGGTNVADGTASTPQRTATVQAMISLEGGDTGASRTPARDAAIATRPYLNVLGDRSDTQGAINYVAALNALQPSVPHRTVYLPDVGIHGNGHTMMLELNNEKIADLLEQWIRKNVKQKQGGGHDDDGTGHDCGPHHNETCY